MPLIPFPSIAKVAGAPVVRRILGVTNKVNSLLAKLLIADALVEILMGDHGILTWVILDEKGNQTLTPDSVISIEYRNESKVMSHPVDPSSFASYNKVQTPYDIRMVVTCGGKGVMTKAGFLSVIDSMLLDNKLYSIITPDKTFLNANLVHADYRRDAGRGVSMLTVELGFMEIRTTAKTTRTTTQQPSGAATTSQGQKSPVAPTVTQAAHAKGVA